jgi:hypothetical protein
VDESSRINKDMSYDGPGTNIFFENKSKNTIGGKFHSIFEGISSYDSDRLSIDIEGIKGKTECLFRRFRGRMNIYNISLCIAIFLIRKNIPSFRLYESKYCILISSLHWEIHRSMEGIEKRLSIRLEEDTMCCWYDGKMGDFSL